MKKLSLMLLILSSVAFASNQEEILEDRVENNLMINLSKELKYDIDYDVDIFQDKMNVELEIEGLREPKIDCEKVSKDVLDIVKKDVPDIKDIDITIKYDQPIGEDKILFNKRFM